MTLLNQLDRWTEQGVISPDQGANLKALASRDVFSVFLELNLLLYIGVLAFIGGLGWTIQTHFQQLGDMAILVGLTGLLAACFGYCFSRVAPYSNAQVPAPNLVFDYVAYLGGLTWSVELAYLESRFHMMADLWDLYLLATALVFFGLAYRFDNRFVLSTALSTLAGWFGIKISHAFGSDVSAYRWYAILYSFVAGGAGGALRFRGIKRHFLGTYLNFAVNFLYVAVVSGVIENGALTLWIAALLVLCGASVAYGISRRQFIYVAYAAVYGYIGVSSILVRNLGDFNAVLSYFVLSGGGMIFLLLSLARRIGKEA